MILNDRLAQPTKYITEQSANRSHYQTEYTRTADNSTIVKGRLYIRATSIPSRYQYLPLAAPTLIKGHRGTREVWRGQVTEEVWNSLSGYYSLGHVIRSEFMMNFSIGTLFNMLCVDKLVPEHMKFLKDQDRYNVFQYRYNVLMDYITEGTFKFFNKNWELERVTPNYYRFSIPKTVFKKGGRWFASNFMSVYRLFDTTHMQPDEWECPKIVKVQDEARILTPTGDMTIPARYAFTLENGGAPLV